MRSWHGKHYLLTYAGSLSPSRQAAASPSHASRHSSLRTNPRVSFRAPRTTRAPQGLRTDEAGHFILYSNLTGCAECASIRLLCRVKTQLRAHLLHVKNSGK